jgi:hypothetical protein
VKEHDVDIAEGIELPPPIPAQGNDGERRRVPPSVVRGRPDRSVENVPEKDVDQLNAQGANLATAAAVLVTQAETMLLNLEEFFVKRQRIRRPHRSRGGKLALGMSENFSKVAGSGHLGL